MDEYGRLVIFWALQALRKRRCTMQQHVQEMNGDSFVKLMNQLNTTALLLPKLRYAKGQKRAIAITQQYGTPPLVHAKNQEGALPARD